jgi:hypothetical protein
MVNNNRKDFGFLNLAVLLLTIYVLGALIVDSFADLA